jgi:hypothetical protein
MTGHAFQVWVGDDELRVSFAAIHTALADGGRFAFETRNPLARAWERWSATEIVDAKGATIRMSYRVDEPVDGDVVRFGHTFSSPSWPEPQTSRSALRFLDVDSLSAFLTGADLQVEEQFGDWDRSPLTAASPEMITVARCAD